MGTLSVWPSIRNPTLEEALRRLAKLSTVVG